MNKFFAHVTEASVSELVKFDFHSSSLLDHAHVVTIPDAHLLFSGDYARSGNDLTISDQDHKLLVPNYFSGDKRPMLVSPEGAPLDARFVDALTGYTAYAQAGPPSSAAKVVGHIVKMTGSASIVRNGVAIVANNGDTLNQNDVVQTGSNSSLGMVLDDGSAFNLSANARCMLDELVYDPSGSSNKSLLTLVQGALSFVAGQTAPTGDMKVATPVAVIGIRGTAVLLDIGSTDGKVSISVADQQDGVVHAVQVFRCDPTTNIPGVCTAGDQIATVTSNGPALSITPGANFQISTQETSKTPAQVTQEFSTFQQVLNTYDAGKQIYPNLPQHTENLNRDNNTNTATTRTAAGSTPMLPSEPPATTVIDNATTRTVADSGDGSASPPPVTSATSGSTGSGSVAPPTQSLSSEPIQLVLVKETPPPSVALEIVTAGGQVNQTVQIISGTVDVTYVGTTVTILDTYNGVTKTLGTATVASGGTWSTSVTLTGIGAHNIVAQDTAANSTTAPVVFTLMATGPTGGTPVLTAAADSGSLHTDGITDVTAPTFVVTLDATVVAGDTVQLLLGGSALAHPVNHTITIADIAAGSVSLTVTAGDLGADGTKSITAQFSDAAGNSSSTSANVITLDTTSPVVAIGSPGGPTSQANLTLTGTIAGADAGTTIVIFDGATQVGVATINGSTWSANVSLSNGSNVLTAQASDAAGNTGTSNSVSYDLNTPPTGTVTISGTAQENQVLTASNTLADADGLGTISYQWQRDGVNVVGATGATYTLGNADVGHTIDVVASYTDGHGTLESKASAATATVTNVNDPPTGTVTISGTAQENQVLTASNTLADADGLGTISYQWQRDGVNVVGATGATYTLGNADVGHTIDVVASYTDGHGTLESKASAATATVTNVNDPPTGTVTISGTAQENQVLTASNTLADADGLGTISYQWQRDGVNVVGATGATYTLGNADVGHTIDVVASYTDGHGTLESKASAATATVTNVNDPPTGTVTISGTAQENQVLTASNTLADADGLGTISYQWQRDGVNVVGATGATYTLGNADVGHTIDVVASYTDGHGTLESKASAATATVTNVNDPPTGTVTISGTAQENQVLTASNTLADADGLGTISYQWQRDGVNVVGATGATYTLGNADVGHTIDVVASYTDGHGTLESKASAATATVTNVNDPPTGTVTISGTAQENQVLTASNTLADADGLGTISYQWQRDGVNVVGATGATYTLGNADVGHTIDVVASYTDGHGTLESKASAATATVTNVNDPPTGTVTISGTAQENQVLTASNTLADADGLGTISYQWQRDGVNVVGATGATYTLGNADVGHTIDVVASYTDGHGTLESKASAATATVTNVNDPPTGTVTISGTAQENQVLTASNTLADADGLGTISYQWQRDGVNVVGATGATYTLGNADVGHTIDVVASYTDGHGTLESKASAATATVTNVNDPPTGTVTISGTAQENQVLTASNTLADADGLGTISYQWQRDGVDVVGATGATYTLGDADVGHTIDVVASYTDGHGTAGEQGQCGRPPRSPTSTTRRRVR